MTARLVRGRWIEDGKRDDSLVEKIRKGREQMSERLTDDEWEDIQDQAASFSSDSSWKRLVGELRERRRADLTDEERDALAKLLGETRDEAVRLADFSHHAVAMKALTKLIGASK